MRRFRITLFTAMALLAVAPATALARGHHQRSHRRHARHARIERFGDVKPTTSGASDNAGRIQSFTDGVLTVALADGSTVRGRVTADTELECMASMREEMSSDSGGDRSDEGDRSGGDQSQASGDGQRGGGDQGDDRGSDDSGEQTDAESNCSMTDLAPGASVREAELRISGASSVWSKVELGA